MERNETKKRTKKNPKKRNKRIGLKIIIIALGVILLFGSTLFMSWSFCMDEVKNDTFYDCMAQAEMSNDRLVTSIAMLGAHDAFTSGITTSSIADPNDDLKNLLGKGLVRALGSGLIVRLSKAQCATAKEMLESGVRYFDVRVTKVEGKYYAMHGILSDELSTYVQDVVNFLKEYPKEFIVFDIQHFNANGKDSIKNSEAYDEYNSLFTFLKSIKNTDNKSIFDYCNYDSSLKELKDLTYGDITLDQTSAGCIVLANTSDFNDVYQRSGNIRSEWHNLNNDKEMIDAINEEYNYLVSNDYSNMFVVNQAQQTGFFTDGRVIGSMFKWSLLNMAKNFNKKMVYDSVQFKNWLSKMPIFMVDNCTSTSGDFNTFANYFILDYNKNYSK